MFLPWEAREKINIYIAAPDFDYVNRTYIELLTESLKYHNFKPRRPVQENGQMEFDAESSRREEIYNKDMTLLSECQLLIAVLINNDPGTLIEIGLAAAKSMGTFVYDPYNQATNCILTQLPHFISNDLDELIAEVFIFASKLNSVHE